MPVMADTAGRTELTVLRDQARQAWRWFEGTVADVTAEQANWWPPGTANSIGATYLHVVINADVEVRRLVFDRVPLVEETFGGQVGQPGAYEPDAFDRWVRHSAVDWARLRDYGRAVHADVENWLEELTLEHLDKPIDMTRAGLGMWEGRELIELHGTHHVRIHGGEIAVLKGLQGQVAWKQSAGFHEAVRVEDARGMPTTGI
ncbi:MAG: DinB family protein [Actinomyces sp.]|nr:MAG: DinB family protein [Actinomyces sp.]